MVHLAFYPVLLVPTQLSADTNRILSMFKALKTIAFKKNIIDYTVTKKINSLFLPQLKKTLKSSIN